MACSSKFIAFVLDKQDKRLLRQQMTIEMAYMY